MAGASLKHRLCGEDYYQNLLSDCRQLVDESNTYNMTRMYAQDRRECCHGDTVVHPVREGQDVRNVTCPEIKSPAEKPRSSLPIMIRNAATNTFECDECHAQYTKRSSRRRSYPTCRESSCDQPTGGILRASSTHIMDERMGDSQTAKKTLNHRSIQDGPRELELQRWKEIEADLDRVFVNGRTRVNTSTGTASMRRVLRAYSLRNPAVGYCQGMNFVVGLLLQVRVTHELCQLHAPTFLRVQQLLQAHVCATKSRSIVRFRVLEITPFTRVSNRHSVFARQIIRISWLVIFFLTGCVGRDHFLAAGRFL